MRVHNNTLIDHMASLTRNHSLAKNRTARPAENPTANHAGAAARKGAVDKRTAAQAAGSSPIATKGPSSADWSATGPSPMTECGPYTPTDPSAPSKPGDAQTMQSLTLEGLLAAWGQRDSTYDLSGNGVVDTDDLLAFINNIPAPAPPAPAAGPTVAMEPEIASAAQVSFEPENQLTIESEAKPVVLPTVSFEQEEPLTLKGLLNDWGQPGSQYDLNSDGTVDVDDLLSYINNLNGQSTPQQAVAGNDHQTKNDFIDSMNVRSSSGRQVADALIDRLAGAGFGHQPPTNIRELVDQLNLLPKDRQQAMDRLGSRYPRGLGLNMVG
jgi:hypothetical protein